MVIHCKMDNSQSSDVFSGSGNYSFEDHAVIIDTVTYRDLVSNTKSLLSKNVKTEAKKLSFCELFSTALDHSGTCITQSLDLVIASVTDIEVNLVQLCENLENVVNILRMLCGFFTEVIEAASLSCSSMKMFPITTGRIITTVFSHCRDSESIYGHHLKAVEGQLKDLFRNCHELQLTYLMIMEKHFLFNLTKYEELSILIEALDINLEIGEMVQTLDVKTMAEQWKAYTMICEKYSDFLMDRHIYEDCTKVLCKMIENNVKSAAEINQEDKIIVRSLKVASFTIKILLKICNIFKHTVNKNYEQIAQSLLFMYLNNSAYLELGARKSPQFLNLVDSNITTPAEVLLKELLSDEQFYVYLFQYQPESTANTENILSYILILISAMKLVVKGNNNKSIKLGILDCIYQWLPDGHIWFNMGLKFKSANNSVTIGLYEHLLTHTFAIASTFDSEEINYLERKMYESLLGTDSYVALFSSNLWELLARLSPSQLLYSQVISLCKVYQTLEREIMFSYCPQQVYLTQMLRKLFSLLSTEDKTRISEQFRISHPNNYGLWSVLGIESSDFPMHSEEIEQLFEHIAIELSNDFNSKTNPEEIEGLIKVMRLSATCSFPRRELPVDFVLKAWMMLCPQNGRVLQGSLWSLEFITALVSLTTSVLPTFQISTDFTKVLHVVSSLIEYANAELKLVLMSLLLNLAQHTCGENHTFDTLLTKTFRFLLQDPNKDVQDKFWNYLRQYKENTRIEKIITKIFHKESSLREKWYNITEESSESMDLKDNLIATTDFGFRHKCIANQNVTEAKEASDSVSAVGKTSSNNFDFADIDTLFEVESDSEPACKKVKLDTTEAEDIIARLEKDVLLLRKVKENVVTSDCKKRIRVLCEKLVNIID